MLRRALTSTWLTALGVGVGGLLLVWLNHDLPIVRNGLVYAKIAVNLLDSGFDLRAVGTSSKLSFHRPLGFPLLAAPFVYWLGPSVGTMASSFVGGIAFLLACVGFFRQFNRRLGIDEKWVKLELLLVFFNPLVLYQFWSAYPDGLFAALVVAALWFLDRAVNDADASPRWLGLVYAAMYGAMLVKDYGIVLIPLHVIYIAHHRHNFGRLVWRSRPHRIAWLSSVAVTAGLLSTSAVGWNPLLNLSPTGGAPSHYLDALVVTVRALRQPRPVVADAAVVSTVEAEPGEGQGLVLPADAGDVDDGAAGEGIELLFSLNQLVVFLVVVFGFTCGFVWSKANLAKPASTIGLMVALFCAGLLSYRFTYFNMRFFIPAAPLISLLIVNGWSRSRMRVAGRLVLVLFFSFNALTIFNYNTRTGFEFFADLNVVTRPYANKPRNYPYFNTDSLRMFAHDLLRREFDHVNQTVPEGATLFLVHSYYDGAVYDVYTRSGCFRSDIHIEHFLDTADVPWWRPTCRASSTPCYMYRIRLREPRPAAPPWRQRPWFVGGAWGLFHIVPVGQPYTPIPMQIPPRR